MGCLEDDPVISSYDVFLTDSEISRYVFQYLDRPGSKPYNERHGQKPTGLRMKPGTGLVELEVPIFTRPGAYDMNKGLKYGEAMKKGPRRTRWWSLRGGRVKSEGAGEMEMLDNKKMMDPSALVRTQALGGRIKPAEEGDPVYMLATFKGKNLHLSPVSAVVQFHPQLHHLDALDEMPKGKGAKGKRDDEDRPPESEARAIDVKIKGAEDGGAMLQGNLDLLKRMQEEKWKKFDWIDAETEESWYTYENYMMNQKPEDLPQLEATINSEAYLDGMSAPRIDPAHPEMTGWAMKQNRQKQKGGSADSEDEE
ncbi:hypothetical protein N7462_004869 [Penicillium macrosclerotiorum]|uniref:uncharacterized protein n=1 Tax=Penicillium macrosclerotiorum TaxID=303699 RepID=UPI002549911D|nr:uncharacterized protein N7462_004869 [Penicillium macrosclerotiorum]KAJ5690477.1 hypothetical protein N7462_004869 [Penicillium macrosclerotiorum]